MSHFNPILRIADLFNDFFHKLTAIVDEATLELRTRAEQAEARAAAAEQRVLAIAERMDNEPPATTECGHCCQVASCVFDGEAYVCVNEEACAERREILWMREIIRETAARALQAEQERDELISAERASVMRADLDNYKAGYEAKTALIHKLVAALARAIEESGHTKFCRAYQDIGECDCWYGEAWKTATDTPE